MATYNQVAIQVIKASSATEYAAIVKNLLSAASRAGPSTAKIAARTSVKAGTKTGTKVAATSAAKASIEWVPFIGAGFSILQATTCVILRWKEADSTDSENLLHNIGCTTAEVASGIVGCVPGLGIAPSLGIDVAVAGLDLLHAYNKTGGLKKPDENDSIAALKKFYQFLESSGVEGYSNAQTDDLEDLDFGEAYGGIVVETVYYGELFITTELAGITSFERANNQTYATNADGSGTKDMVGNDMHLSGMPKKYRECAEELECEECLDVCQIEGCDNDTTKAAYRRTLHIIDNRGRLCLVNGCSACNNALDPANPMNWEVNPYGCKIKKGACIVVLQTNTTYFSVRPWRMVEAYRAKKHWSNRNVRKGPYAGFLSDFKDGFTEMMNMDWLDEDREKSDLNRKKRLIMKLN